MTASKKKKFFVQYLPIYGCFSTGIIYVAIGVIAILSFLRIKDGGADETGLLAYLNGYLAGQALIVVILLGTVSYIVWRLYETVRDPYGYGREATGMAKRTGIALSTVADALIAYAAIEVLLGISNYPENGQPDEQRNMVRQMLQESWGNWLVIGIGAVISTTAVIQFVYGVTKGYRERLDIKRFRSSTKSLIHVLAWVGYFARGIILGIIGFFFIKAGMVENARYVVNTDKAFDFIGDHVGHVYFILVAIGTICYGLFMFALGLTYDTDNDKPELAPE